MDRSRAAKSGPRITVRLCTIEGSGRGQQNTSALRCLILRGAAGRAPDLDALLASVDLDTAANRTAHDLNSAQQKALDLARALATAPRLLLVDELAAGLNPAELGRMAGRLRALADGGMALLVVSSELDEVVAYSDRVRVLRDRRHVGDLVGDAISVAGIIETIASEARP